MCVLLIGRDERATNLEPEAYVDLASSVFNERFYVGGNYFEIPCVSGDDGKRFFNNRLFFRCPPVPYGVVPSIPLQLSWIILELQTSPYDRPC